MEAVFENIKRILEEKHIEHQIATHDAVFTSLEASLVRGVSLQMGVKAMVLKTGDHFIVVLIRADKKVDLKLIKKLEHAPKIRLASAEEVLEVTQCEIGSVPPFGFLKPLKTYLDKDVLLEETITFNAGLHTVSVLMRGGDLPKVLSGILF